MLNWFILLLAILVPVLDGESNREPAAQSDAKIHAEARERDKLKLLDLYPFFALIRIGGWWINKPPAPVRKDAH